MVASSAVRLVVVIVVSSLGGATVGIAGGQATPSRATVNSATFQDAVGEDPAGPDVTSVSVANDDAGGLTFRVSIPSHPVLTEDMQIRILLDYDNSAETGNQVRGRVGVDTVLSVDSWLQGFGVAWGPDSLRFSYEHGVARFSLDSESVQRQMNLPLRRLRFFVQVVTGTQCNPVPPCDFTNTRKDYAPVLEDFPSRDQYWVYESRRLIMKSFSTSPAPPRAGKPFAIRLAATRTDTGALLTSGAVSCSLVIAGKPLRARSRGFVGSRATCVYAIPASAKRKSYRSTISVSANRAKVSGTRSGRVR